MQLDNDFHKIVIAPDSFKESLNAYEVARAIEEGLQRIFPDAEYDIVPMADGGEGTVDAMIHATGGNLVCVNVLDPLGREIEAKFGILGDRKTAIIEMASASGLPLLKPDERNPMKTSTYGTGQLIRAALDKGVERIIIGIGGSATVDGGAGMISALGGKLLDANGTEIEPTGAGLAKISCIDLSNFDKRIYQTEILIASDVDNPLIGQNGAAYVFGPQKGADAEMVEQLDANLERFARHIKEQIGIDVANISGAGAAGGLGGALIAFCKAKMRSGSELIAQSVNIAERLEVADLCITGEGKIDGQSVCGKVCWRVADIAHNKNIPVIALVGAIGEGAQSCIPPLNAMLSILSAPMNLEEAMKQTYNLLADSAEQLARLLTIKR